jgi:hypothetical protein
MNYEDFFWLHIKKSAGVTTRKLLQPYYTEVDKKYKPKTFIQAKSEEYNDILNNFRVVLGEYQFKRSLFAKKFLYPNNWESIYSFAFSREPIDRCISMFYYLHHQKRGILRSVLNVYHNIKSQRKIGFSLSYDFDLFLDLIQAAHCNSNSNYKPSGIAFSTHTAPMFNDITDEKGNIILSTIYRLEDLHKAIEEVFRLCGLEYKNSDKIVFANKNTKRGVFSPNIKQRKKIYRLYEEDFEIYEKASKSLR